MSTIESEKNEWYATETKLRLVYGDKAYQRITEIKWWKYRYCERRKKLTKQIERQRKTINKPWTFSLIGAGRETMAKKNRQNGQRTRWMMRKFSRQSYLKRLGPIECTESLVTKMSRHPHHVHIWAVANYPGVTGQQLTDVLGVVSANHRMVFQRLNNDLYHVGWQFVSSPIGFKNEPWGWYLEKI